ATKACKLDKWKYAAEIDTLAAAYAETGDFDSAIRYQEQAISVKKSEPEEMSKWVAKRRMNKELAEKITDRMTKEFKKSSAEYAQRLALYKQHRPYRGTGEW